MKRIAIILSGFLALGVLSCVKEKPQEPLQAEFSCDAETVLVGEPVTFSGEPLPVGTGRSKALKRKRPSFPAPSCAG